jgi:hypothetical protein
MQTKGCEKGYLYVALVVIAMLIIPSVSATVPIQTNKDTLISGGNGGVNGFRLVCCGEPETTYTLYLNNGDLTGVSPISTKQGRDDYNISAISDGVWQFTTNERGIATFDFVTDTSTIPGKYTFRFLDSEVSVDIVDYAPAPTPITTIPTSAPTTILTTEPTPEPTPDLVSTIATLEERVKVQDTKIGEIQKSLEDVQPQAPTETPSVVDTGNQTATPTPTPTTNYDARNAKLEDDIRIAEENVRKQNDLIYQIMKFLGLEK